MFLDSFDLFQCDKSDNDLEYTLNASPQISVLANVNKSVKDSQPLAIHGNNQSFLHESMKCC